MDNGKLTVRIQHENENRLKKNNVKVKSEKYIMIFGGLVLFFLTFFIYEIFAEPEPENKVKVPKTNNKDIIAQINEIEKERKSREEKESKIADDIFLGKNSSVSEYADRLIKELKEGANFNKEGFEIISDKNNFENDNIKTEFPENEESNIFGKLNNKEVNDFEFDPGLVELKGNYPQKTENNLKINIKRMRKLSIIAFSNINRNARVYNNGREFIVRDLSSIREINEKKNRVLNHNRGGELRKNNLIRLVYNNNPLRIIYEGEFLEAVLVNRIINDKNESPVTAVIIKDFFDKKGEYVLLPASTRLIGNAIPISGQQDNRLIIKFHRFLLPNGESVFFEEKNNELLALNSQGVLGLKGKVNRHLLKKYGAALFFGLMNGIGRFAGNRIIKSSGMSFMIERSSENFENLNNRISGNSMNIVPTITVKEGSRLKIFVSADIEISAYQRIRTRSYYKN